MNAILKYAPVFQAGGSLAWAGVLSIITLSLVIAVGVYASQMTSLDSSDPKYKSLTGKVIGISIALVIFIPATAYAMYNYSQQATIAAKQLSDGGIM